MNTQVLDRSSKPLYLFFAVSGMCPPRAISVRPLFLLQGPSQQEHLCGSLSAPLWLWEVTLPCDSLHVSMSVCGETPPLPHLALKPWVDKVSISFYCVSFTCGFWVCSLLQVMPHMLRI